MVSIGGSLIRKGAPLCRVWDIALYIANSIRINSYVDYNVTASVNIEQKVSRSGKRPSS